MHSGSPKRGLDTGGPESCTTVFRIITAMYYFSRCVS
uniref:Uncharacterized protein n=1 Tax=Arundo donax TaxID=35708 RepID=A0A0A8ZIL8_ARUDO